MRDQDIRALVASLIPGGELLSARALSPDGSAGETRKAAGYVRPLLLTVAAAGEERRFVLRFGKPDDFGHARRSDRVQRFLLAYDAARHLPRHAAVLDVGLVHQGRELRSLGGGGEPYLLAEFTEGTPYAADLRRVADEGRCGPADLARAEALAGYLAELHGLHLTPGRDYRRSVRDLLGHGEGLFGMVDGYPDDVPAAPPARLKKIEGLAWEWRWRLRGRDARFARLHGDFHPFNVLFRGGSDFTAIGAARGCAGDPADDVTALAINYVFFALDRRRAAWDEGLGPLWRTFWATYLDETGDQALLEVAAPFLAWRALVLASPRFYPGLAARDRDTLLSFAEDALARDAFDPSAAEALF